MKGIYKIISIRDNKFYVGSTNNFANRNKYHFRYLRKNKHWNKHLQNAYNLYGEDNFKFVTEKHIIDNISTDELLQLEQEYLDKYQAETPELLYNTNYKANKPPSRIGSHPTITEEHKYKISLQRGWKHTQESKEKMSKSRKGKTWEDIYGIEGAAKKRLHNSLKLKNKISKLKGKNISEIHKNKISKALTGRIISDKCRNTNIILRSKQVKQIDIITGEMINVFPSAKIAEISLTGKECKGVSAACTGKQKTALGFKWEYIKE